MSKALTPMNTIRVFLAQLSIYQRLIDPVTTYLKMARPSRMSRTTIPKIHPPVTNFLDTNEVLNRLITLSMRVSKLMPTAATPMMRISMRKDADQELTRNKGAQTRFPGAFVYRWPHTSLIANVINTISKVMTVSMMEKWQKMRSAADPLNPCMALTTIMPIAISKFNAKIPKNRVLGNPSEHLIRMIVSKFTTRRAYAMQLMMVGFEKSQSVSPSFQRAQYAIMSCDASWKDRRNTLNALLLGSLMSTSIISNFKLYPPTCLKDFYLNYLSGVQT